MELPCNAESHHSAPAPGEPSQATVLVTVASPQGQDGCAPSSVHGPVLSAQRFLVDPPERGWSVAQVPGRS
eukprot:15449187-Alexandrium_andersonii.AAC.1